LVLGERDKQNYISLGQKNIFSDIYATNIVIIASIILFEAGKGDYVDFVQESL
jgi:hypothetical protein